MLATDLKAFIGVAITQKIGKGVDLAWLISGHPVFSFSWWGKSGSTVCQATEAVVAQLVV